MPSMLTYCSRLVDQETQVNNVGEASTGEGSVQYFVYEFPLM